MRPDPATASVVSVVAPAGYGKTTLLTAWAAHADVPAMWLSLDERDDDPVVLATSIAHALMREAGDAGGLADAVATHEASIWSTLMPRISAAMLDLPPFVLVLDDLHSVSSPKSLDIVNWLALHMPPGSQLHVAGRSAVGLVVPRLRMERRLVELGIRDLRLDDEEAFELLAGSHSDVTATEASTINRECDGWVGGLILSALTTAWDDGSRREPASGDPVAEYLHFEVLAGLAPNDAEFLRQTSFLRELSGSLCDYVLERSDSASVLHRLAAANAFVSRIGVDRFRCHELFREVLVAGRWSDEEGMRMRRRAADWHATEGDPIEAVRYARESGDLALAGAMIGRFAQDLFNDGRTDTTIGWLDWAESAGLVARHPGLAVLGTMGFALSGDAERADRWSRAVDVSSPAIRLGVDDAELEALQALLGALLCHSGAKAALVHALRACDLMSDGDSWRGAALVALGLCHMMMDSDGDARAAFEEVVDPRSASAPSNSRALAWTFLARIALADHDIATAAGHIARARDLRAQHGITGQAMQVPVDAISARVLLATGADAREARAYLAHAQTVRPLLTWVMPGAAMLGRLDLIRAHLVLNDAAGARLLLREVADIERHRPGLGALAREADELRGQLTKLRETPSGPSALTVAELRLVPWLATHLSFREIGERLFLSGNTVKSEALAIYRKLGASSRSEAVTAAIRVGLLDAAALPGVLGSDASLDDQTAAERFTPSG